jgi:hypothetical protein
MDYLDINLLSDHFLSVGGDYRNQGTTDNKDFYSITALYIQFVMVMTCLASRPEFQPPLDFNPFIWNNSPGELEVKLKKGTLLDSGTGPPL